MRSSELPVARYRLSDSVGGEMARQRTEEAWAAKRKVSEKVVVDSSSLELLLLRAWRGMLAVKPCSTRSYEPVTTWMDSGWSLLAFPFWDLRDDVWTFAAFAGAAVVFCLATTAGFDAAFLSALGRAAASSRFLFPVAPGMSGCALY